MSFDSPNSSENNSGSRPPAKSGKKLTYLSLVLSVVAILLSVVAIGSSEESSEVIETATPIANSDTPSPADEESEDSGDTADLYQAPADMEAFIDEVAQSLVLIQCADSSSSTTMWVTATFFDTGVDGTEDEVELDIGLLSRTN